MNENTSAYDWATTRGEKWLAQVVRLEAMMAPVDEPLIQSLQLDRPYRIADIGCGGGGTSLEILRRAPAGSVVHGFDISSALIESACARVPAGEDHIAFTLADVAIAPQPQLYNRLVSRFGIMFYDDPPAAFANLLRWLNPGGRFTFAVWGQPTDNPWMTSVGEAIAAVMTVPPPDRAAPGPFRYAAAETLLVLLRQAGFAELQVDDWRGTLSIGGGLSPAEATNFALSSFSSFAEQLMQAGEKALQTVRESLLARFSGCQQNGVVCMDACIHIVTGIRPLN